MRAFQTQSRRELGLSDSGWDQLSTFLETAKPVISKARNRGAIESPPPAIHGEDGDSTAVFAPGGWVGEYPAGVNVYPDKLTKAEYRRLLRDIAGWIEIWDVPTAAAMLPIYSTKANDERSIILGYSRALQDFTDDILAQRPPVMVQRISETGTQPRGGIDFHQTMQARARRGNNNTVVYDRLQFSFDHPVNQLMIRFHAELEARLRDLAAQSHMLSQQLRAQQQYHARFLDEQFSEALVKQSRERSLAALVSASTTHEDTAGRMTELINLCDAYLQERALAIDFQQRLSIGLKPISKLLELWVLGTLLTELQQLTGRHPQLTDDGLHEITVGSAITVYYNTTIPRQSRFLAGGLQANPGRPDFAISLDSTIVWIGDAKYRPTRNIGLESYQRLLSYAVDLMPSDGPATAAIIHVDRHAEATTISTPDYSVAEFCHRPTAPGTPLLPTSLQDRLSDA